MNFKPKHFIGQIPRTTIHQFGRKLLPPVGNPAQQFFDLSFNSSWIKQPSIDPRDIKINIAFEGIMQKLDGHWEQTHFDRIRDWLILVVQTICSDAFMKLHQEQLLESEVKNFCSKNLVYNIYQLMYKLSNLLSLEIREKITTFIDSELRQIISQVIIKYPQASGKTSVRKLKAAISRPDNRESNQFDLFRFPKKTGVEFKFKENGDYSSQLMQAINYIIKVASDYFNKKRKELSNFEAFQMTIQLLFNIAGQTEIEERIISSYKAAMQKHGDINYQEIQKVVQDKEFIQSQLTQYQREKLQINGVEKDTQKNYSDLKKQSDIIIQQNSEQQNRSFKINQKISGNTPLFSDQQIENGKFRVPDSTVLRVMTKWAEQLREYLKDARSNILNRVELFKAQDGQLIQFNSQFNVCLYEAAIKQQKQIQKLFSNLKQECMRTQAMIFSKLQKAKYTNSVDANLGIFAAKTQDCVGQYTFSYLNQLISALMRIPQMAYEAYVQRHPNKVYEAENLRKVNLVTFKIGDLMRSRCKAPEKDIISIYKLMERISQQCPKILQIVRVKDRLDGSDKDLLINIHFSEKVLCQVQLSVIGSIEKKQEQFNSFNHFIYELKRSEFGPIAEAACVMTNYDPLIKNFAQRERLQPDLLQRKSQKHNDIAFDFGFLNEQTKVKDDLSNTLPFFCSSCNSFCKINNPQFFLDRVHCEEYKQCRSCYQQRMMNDSKNQNKFMRELFRKLMLPESKQVQAIIQNYEFLKADSIKGNCYDLFFNQIDDGIVILKDSKVPTPIYFKSTQFEGISNIVIKQSKKKGKYNSKIILKFDQYSSKRKQLKEFDKAYFLVRKNSGSQIINKKAKIRNSAIGAHQQDQNLQQECVFLKTKSIQLFLSIDFDAKKDTILQANQKQLKYISKNKKEVIQLIQRQVTTELKDLPYMKYVKRCYVSSNQIEQINFQSLQRIEKLDIQSNCIKSLQKLKNIRNLKQFRCGNNGLVNLKGIPECNKIQNLYLNDNKLISLKQLAHMENLKTLDCSGNPLISLQGIQNCKDLEVLSASHHQQRQSTQGIQNMTKLFFLDSSYCKLKRLGNVSSLSALSHLLAGFNQIQSLDDLQHSKSLEYLNLQNNKIFDLKSLKYLSKMKSLNISCNQISTLQGLQSMNQLKSLNVSYNQNLQSLDLTDQVLSNLEQLNLNGTNFKQLSKIKNAKKLRIFKICELKTSMTNLKDIENLISLQQLYCSMNKLENISYLKYCLNLQQLHCENNNIKDVSALAYCKKLCVFKWANNPIDNELIKKIPSLKYIEN